MRVYFQTFMIMCLNTLSHAKASEQNTSLTLRALTIGLVRKDDDDALLSPNSAKPDMRDFCLCSSIASS